MTSFDTIEGVVEETCWFHYDVSNDALYLQLLSERRKRRRTPAYGEETPDGLIEFRTDSGRLIGLTIVNWWKRFGSGTLVDNPLCSLQPQVEALARRLAA